MLKYTFLAHKIGVAKSSGNPYNMLELALGHRNFTVTSKLSADDTKELVSEKDVVEIQAELTPDYSGNARAVVTGIRSVGIIEE